MIKFLIKRPIAVIMAFTAALLLGLITYSAIPISLLPDIAIPQINIQVNEDDSSARELENSIIAPLRSELLQISGLDDINSVTSDGNGTITLFFKFETNIDLASIEVNEKVDMAMSKLPRDIERPRIVKASATDIPILYLNLSLKGDDIAEYFTELSTLADNIIKRRIEQQPEVVMVDVTGLIKTHIKIVPDFNKIKMVGLRVSHIESALKDNNIEPINMVVNDGYYQYNVKLSNMLQTLNDVENIYIRKGEKILQLKDLAKVTIEPEGEQGVAYCNGKRSISLAIIKQADESMEKMRSNLTKIIDEFETSYPDVEFTISRDQTQLLEYTISNLRQNILIAFILIFFTAVIFLGDVKSPFVIAITMVVSLAISVLSFYLFDISFNIISLSGLILALGMMIDSSIVITENIAQYRDSGLSVDRACDRGTSEVIIPLLSSTLTTISVFLPLIFLSGISGALFFDQAFAVTSGLLVSYVTGILLLPVLYRLIYTDVSSKKGVMNLRFNNPIKDEVLYKMYDNTIDLIFRYRAVVLVSILLSLGMSLYLFHRLPKGLMPELEQSEMVVSIDWNENIHLQENKRRIISLFNNPAMDSTQHTCYLGAQGYILNQENQIFENGAELYVSCPDKKDVKIVQNRIRDLLSKEYPYAIVEFSAPESLFESLFSSSKPDIVAELYNRDRNKRLDYKEINTITDSLTIDQCRPLKTSFFDELQVKIDYEKLMLYNIDINDLYEVLQQNLHSIEITTLRSDQYYLPIAIASEDKDINEALLESMIRVSSSDNVKEIPVTSLISMSRNKDVKEITSGMKGEYIPMKFFDVKEPGLIYNSLKSKLDKGSLTIVDAESKTTNNWDVIFSGSFFSNQKMLDQLIVILLVSILLMYFILAAQFESFVQPFIVLLEIPIDIAFALLVLWLTGNTLNLMSAIGIVVTCGIIINDSILKIDAINELKKRGTPLIEAIHIAGRRRLRPIIMTSLTTTLGLLPILFSWDMGSELQKPLAIAMISAMTIGTIVSITVIPLLYWYIYRDEKNG